ncbi:hypothetical protein LP420_17685 [Massilia sp. B-10]|nr:hypothetical protein LP420_17685 [Massilia sp. B-10]
MADRARHPALRQLRRRRPDRLRHAAQSDRLRTARTGGPGQAPARSGAAGAVRPAPDRAGRSAPHDAAAGRPERGGPAAAKPGQRPAGAGGAAGGRRHQFAQAARLAQRGQPRDRADHAALARPEGMERLLRRVRSGPELVGQASVRGPGQGADRLCGQPGRNAWSARNRPPA